MKQKVIFLIMTKDQRALAYAVLFQTCGNRSRFSMHNRNSRPQTQWGSWMFWIL